MLHRAVIVRGKGWLLRIRRLLRSQRFKIFIHLAMLPFKVILRQVAQPRAHPYIRSFASLFPRKQQNQRAAPIVAQPPTY